MPRRRSKQAHLTLSPEKRSLSSVRPHVACRSHATPTTYRRCGKRRRNVKTNIVLCAHGNVFLRRLHTLKTYRHSREITRLVVMRV